MRSTVRDAARRAYLAITRGTVKQAADDHLMQEVTIDGLYAETFKNVERFQPYGHTSVPLPEDEQSMESAEVVLLFVHGNRSHPIVIALDDRRYRPNGLTPGESALYDDQGQQVYISRDRISVSSDKEVHIQVGNSHFLMTANKLKVQYDDLSVTIKDHKIFLGKEDVPHAVETADGTSQKVFAVIDEVDSPMDAAPKVKRTKPT